MRYTVGVDDFAYWTAGNGTYVLRGKPTDVPGQYETEAPKKEKWYLLLKGHCMTAVITYEGEERKSTVLFDVTTSIGLLLVYPVQVWRFVRDCLQVKP